MLANAAKKNGGQQAHDFRYKVAQWAHDSVAKWTNVIQYATLGDQHDFITQPLHDTVAAQFQKKKENKNTNA